jgi:type VI secretion system protein ImpA
VDKIPEGLDLAALLAPISEEASAGTDLRTDYSPGSLYYRLRDARAEARAIERASEAPRDPGDPRPVEAATGDAAAGWHTVRALGIEALTTRSKDLEIAAWLTEALLRSDSLAGLTAGVRLMTGLVETFWDDLFPVPDEDGIATRVAPLVGLNGVSGTGSLIQPLAKVDLFQRPDGAPLELWQYQQSFELAGIDDEARRQQRIEAGAVPFETLENEARAAGSAGFVALQVEAAEAAAAWRALGEALDSRVGADAPPTSHVRDLLEQIRSVAARFGGSAAAQPTEPGAEPGDAAAPEPGDAAVTAVRPQGLNSREEALRTLVQIAEFFRRTEPNSPLAYTLQEAVRRGRLTWPELIAEIVPDITSRSAILSSLGIRPPPPE